MSNGNNPQQTATGPTFSPVGIMCPANPIYPPVVTKGQGGYPGPEWGPHAVPPGCAFGLPTLVFAGPWQH